MENVGRLVEKPEEQLEEIRGVIVQANQERLETTSHLLYVVSLFDTKLQQSTTRATASKLKQDLMKNEITEDEIESIVQFAEKFTANTNSQKWKKTPASNGKTAFSELQKLNKEQGTGSKTKYVKLHDIATKITKTPVYTSVYRKKTEPEKEKWRGGSMRDYIRIHGHGMVETLTYKCRREKKGQEHIKLEDRAVEDVTMTEKRLTPVGRRILGGIMKQARCMHGCNKVFGELLSIDRIHLTSSPDLKVVIKRSKEEKIKPTEHDKKTCQGDCTNLQEIIRAMLGSKDQSLPADSPKDVKHLYKLLAEAEKNGFEEYHEAIFNHPCIWSPSDMIKIIIGMRMFVSKEMKKPYQNRKESTKNTLAYMNTFVDSNWSEAIELQRSLYGDVYASWKFDVESAGGMMSSNPGFKVLSYMRNCFPHAGKYDVNKLKWSRNLPWSADLHSSLESSKKAPSGVQSSSQEKSGAGMPGGKQGGVESLKGKEETEAGSSSEGSSINSMSRLQVEQDLFVMFPTYISELFLATRKYKFSFGDLCSGSSYE